MPLTFNGRFFEFAGLGAVDVAYANATGAE